MSGKLETTKEVIMAQIDICGNATAYLAHNANGVVSDDVMWAINQATIALNEAFRILAGDKE